MKKFKLLHVTSGKYVEAPYKKDGLFLMFVLPKYYFSEEVDKAAQRYYRKSVKDVIFESKEVAIRWLFLHSSMIRVKDKLPYLTLGLASKFKLQKYRIKKVASKHPLFGALLSEFEIVEVDISEADFERDYLGI